MKFIIICLFFLMPFCLNAQKKTPMNEKIYEKVEIQLEFKGSFINFLEENLKFPENADEYNCNSFIIKFIVFKNGTIGNIKIDKNSPCKNVELDKLFIDLIKKTNGKWTPGVLKGKYVSCWHSKTITACLIGD